MWRCAWLVCNCETRESHFTGTSLTVKGVSLVTTANKWQPLHTPSFHITSNTHHQIFCKLHQIWFWYRSVKSTTVNFVELLLSGKGKAIVLQAWTGPEGSRRLRLQDSRHVKVVRLPVLHTGCLYPQEIFPVLISVRGWVYSRIMHIINPKYSKVTTGCGISQKNSQNIQNYK